MAGKCSISSAQIGWRKSQFETHPDKMRTSGGANLKLPRLILFHSFSESFRLSSDFFIYGAGRNCLFCVELTLKNPNLHFLLFLSVIQNLLVPFTFWFHSGSFRFSLYFGIFFYRSMSKCRLETKFLNHMVFNFKVLLVFNLLISISLSAMINDKDGTITSYNCKSFLFWLYFLYPHWASLVYICKFSS